MSSNNSKPFLFLRVSIFSHVEICSLRAKTETFSHKRGTVYAKRGSAIAIGNRQHREYSQFITDFDRDILRSNLSFYKINGAFERVLDLPEVEVIVRGDYDDLRVVTYRMQKLVSFIELKTTGKKGMWELEVRAAIRQLQIYLWMLKDICVRLGYPLWKRHYVEIFSQITGQLIRRIPVEYDEHIEEWITEAVYKIIGLKQMNIAPYRYCMICSPQVKNTCSYYEMRKT